RLADGSAEVRAAAAWALGSLEDAAGMGPLAQALQDPDPGTRAGAAWALGRLGAPARAQLPALIAHLEDPEESVRWRVGDALGRIGADAAAVAPLRAVLRAPEGRGRAEA